MNQKEYIEEAQTMTLLKKKDKGTKYDLHRY